VYDSNKAKEKKERKKQSKDVDIIGVAVIDTEIHINDRQTISTKKRIKQ